MCDYGSIEINSAVFEDDYDNVGYEPIKVDDSDDNAAEFFGYN